MKAAEAKVAEVVHTDTASYVGQKIMLCPICGQEHLVPVYAKETTVEIRGLKGTYMKHYCICERNSRKFIPGWMVKKNIHRAKASVHFSPHTLGEALRESESNIHE